MFLYFRMFLVMGVALYTSRIILRTLGIEDYGIYNVVGGVVTMFSFLSGCLSSATSRFITFELGRKDYIKLRTTFNAALLVHIIIGLLIVILAETIGLWFFYEKMSIPYERVDAAFWVFQISILTIFCTISQVPYDAVVIAHENMKVYSYVGIVEVVMKLVVVYLLLISPTDRLVFYAILLFLVQLLKIVFTVSYCVRKYSESHIQLCKDKRLYMDIFKYAGSDMIGSVSVMAQGQGINLLLNVYFGPVVNAARAVAYQVQGAVTQFSNNFMTAVRPQIIKSYAEGNLKDMWKLVYQSSCFSFYLMLLICLPICFEADYVLTLWLGKYPDHTVNFLILIIVLCMIQTLKTPRTTIFHATGKVFWANITVGIVLCLAFPLAYLFLELGGSPESVFGACIISMVLSELVSVFVLRRFLEFSIPRYLLYVHGRCVLVSLISILMPYLLYSIFLPQSFLRLLSTCLLTTLSVVITSLYVGMNSEMRTKLYSLVKKKMLKR